MERFNVILNKSIKVLVVANIIIMLTIGSFFVQPVFAAESDYIYKLPSPVSTNFDDTLPIYQYYYSSAAGLCDFVYSSNYDIYCTVYTRSNGTLSCLFVSASSGTNYQSQTFSLKSGSPVAYSSPSTVSLGASYNDTGFYFYDNDLYNGSQFSLLVNSSPYTSFDEAMQALITYIDNASLSSFSNTVVVEPGYIVFALCEGGSVDMRTQMPVNSSLNVVGIPWDSTSRIAFGVDRPTSGTTYDAATFGSRINWDKDSAADSNWLGMTKFAVAHYDDLPSNGSFVAIMNPAYYGDSIQNPDVNGSIYATFSNLGAVVKYPMNTSLTLGVGGVMRPVITSNTDWSDYAIAVPTTDGAISAPNYIWNNTSQPAIEFPDGGQNDISHSNNDIQGIAGLINRLINLLSSPVDHIKSLFNAGSAYFSVLAQMFTWLPPEVYSVLVNCLICALVIGVIKLLF